MKQKHRVRLSCSFKTKEYIKTSHLWQRNRPDWGQEEKGTTEDEMAGWHH